MSSDPPTPSRRARYRGSHPRRFDEKYKEHGRNPETVAKVRSKGKTPAGQHVPILVEELLRVLDPQPGQRGVDATLGHGGHAEVLLQKVKPDGIILGLDQDPLELPRTVERLRGLGHTDESFVAKRCNFAGINGAIQEMGWTDGVDLILADLGVSSMQLDNPARGFSFKLEGPLDMRMNPDRGQSAAELLRKVDALELAQLLRDNADEPCAGLLGEKLVVEARGGKLNSTTGLTRAIEKSLPRHLNERDRDLSVRRVFQALRIAVNDEFGVLDAFLRVIPSALRPGGRVAILTFHSGEDRRVKKAFQSAHREGVFSEISENVIRPQPKEVRANLRASAAKLRWARRAESGF